MKPKNSAPTLLAFHKAPRLSIDGNHCLPAVLTWVFRLNPYLGCKFAGHDPIRGGDQIKRPCSCTPWSFSSRMPQPRRRV